MALRGTCWTPRNHGCKGWMEEEDASYNDRASKDAPRPLL